MDKKDSSLVDWSKLESSPLVQHKTSSKKKRAQHELRKCMGNEECEETVIKSYSCAWQKDILVQGRLHLTQNWICFYSNILGWETKTSIRLRDVTAISKQRTALVFPNAILIEAGDKKYGFASFVHRDKSYNVIQVIWQNSQLQNPSTGEALREQLSHLTWQQRHSPIGRRSKSSSITGDSSDVELSSPAHSPSHSATRIKDTPTNPKVQETTGSESDAEGGEKVDEGVYGPEHLPDLPSSTCSSDAGSEQSSIGSCRTPLDDPDQISDVDGTGENTDHPFCKKKNALKRSPSLVTLRPSSSEVSANQIGGSPHHWPTPSVTAIWETVVALAKPQHLAQLCSPSRLISILIIIFIVLLLLSTISMLCQLSKVEPALQPYLQWQPWCSVC